MSPVVFLAGLLLVLYVVLNQYFHGKVFISLNFVVDTIFEIVYCLFPLLYLSGNDLFSLSSLGILGQQNGFIIIQSLFAMVTLSRKCIFLMRDLNPTQIAQSHWFKVTRKVKVDHLTPWILNKSYNNKIRYQGFGNSDLYRLIVARFETKNIILRRKSMIEIQGVGNQRISQLNTNSFDLGSSSDLELDLDSNLQQLDATDEKTMVSASSPSSASMENNSNGISDELQLKRAKSDSISQNPKESDEKDSSSLHSIRNQLNGAMNTQQNRKCIVAGCGCSFITTGIMLMMFFIGFIENDYKNKCIYSGNLNDTTNKSNSDEWFELHPELKYFDMDCRYQVVNIFSNYPCNCRQYLRYYNNETNYISAEMVELVFLNYDDLQNVFFQGDLESNVEYYFTNEMLNRMKYLQIWTMHSIAIGYNWSPEGTSKLKNLEIFGWIGTGAYIGSTVSFPFKQFATLDKMKAIDISNVANLANEKIPDDICNLKQMRLFDINFAPYVEYIPYDCIAQNWKELRWMKFDTFPQILSITPDIWKLPNLRTVILANNGFTVASKSFDLSTFDGFSESLTRVLLASTFGVCHNGSVVINGAEYKGFGYLSNSTFSSSDVENDDTKLLEFIQTFDPCAATCSTVTFGCGADVWQDGLCSDQCNRDECDYDGGDCNQLCDCEYDLWFNNECDTQCNTTQCSWDFYQCVQTPSLNETCSLENGNATNSMNDASDEDIGSIPCYTLWIDDTWCDAACNVETCHYDEGWCNGCAEDSQCGSFWNELKVIPAEDGSIYGTDLFTKERICQYKDIILHFFDGLDQSDNCSDVFDLVDLNDNGFIGFYELLQQFAFQLGLTTHPHWQEKVTQLDCSACLVNATYYYW